MNDNRYSKLVEQLMQIQWILIRSHHQYHHNMGLMENPYRGQGRILKILKMKPEITQKELLELLDMRPQSLGTLLRKLEQKGYITRTTMQNDKRAMIIRLTDKGANAEIQDDKQLGLETLFDCLSDEEQLQLSEYLSRIINEWRGDSDKGPDFEQFGYGGFRGWHR